MVQVLLRTLKLVCQSTGNVLSRKFLRCFFTGVSDVSVSSLLCVGKHLPHRGNSLWSAAVLRFCSSSPPVVSSFGKSEAISLQSRIKLQFSVCRSVLPDQAPEPAAWGSVEAALERQKSRVQFFLDPAGFAHLSLLGYCDFLD